MADNGLCFGDHICLYSEELYGYAYSFQSSLVHSEIALWPRQDRIRPDVPDPQVFTFEVCASNRYKLNKRYKKALAKSEANPDNLRLKQSLTQAKIAGTAEDEDNDLEQRRQNGKKVFYGQLVQLRHIFTEKYVHVNTMLTSKTESSNMMVELLKHNAKNAHFRIMPRYKVKAEGDFVQVEDQIVLESLKTLGQYVHVSKVPFSQQSVYSYSHMQKDGEKPYQKSSHEINLSVIQSGFTIYRRYKHSVDDANFLKAGQLVQLFHKELEAYLTVEGLFDNVVSDGVHLRIRTIDQTIPKTMLPSSSAITYWQIELEEGPTNGGIVRWSQQCRIKHVTTRMYLKLDDKKHVSLTPDHRDPCNVFKLHPVIKNFEQIGYDTYCRIEHSVTGHWLHATNDEYIRQEEAQSSNQSSMASLKWTTASARQLVALPDMQYDDAFTVQIVEPELVTICNFISGMVPFLQQIIRDKRAGQILDAKRTHETILTLQELKAFMSVNSVPCKDRQKLVRNFRVVELLGDILKIPYRHTPDQHHLMAIFVEAYDTLYTYLMGDSRKNELYIAKHIDFFQTQIECEGNIGLSAAHMVMELIKDNRKIVDRITTDQINHFVDLLKQNKNYRYLDLLSVLCVCNGVSIPDNQNYITKVWLMEGKNCVYYTELGQKINKEHNVVYVSVNNQRTWTPLHDFAMQKLDHADEMFEFLDHQLDLFGKLCYGRNEFAIKVITEELKYLSWEEAYLCLITEELPDQLRAKYCHLITGLFVDVGQNHDILENVTLTFLYDDLTTGLKGKQRPVTAHVKTPRAVQFDIQEEANVMTTVYVSKLRDWIANFLDQNHDMTASLIGHNMLVEQVIRLIHFLVKFGFYDQRQDMSRLLGPLLDLLDGRNDKPYPHIKGVEELCGADAKEVLNYYRTYARFIPGPETKAIVDAKYRAMEVLDLFLNFSFNTRLEGFAAMFKDLYTKANRSDFPPPDLGPLLMETFDLDDHSFMLSPARKSIQQLFDDSVVFKGYDLVGILKDLSCYEYDYMVTQSMNLLHRHFSSHETLFKRAVQAQVLLTENSEHVLVIVQKLLPSLRRFATSKMNDKQTELMVGILNQLIRLCCLDDDLEEHHPMNQAILYNHGLIEDMFNILSQDVDVKLMDQYQGLQKVFKLSFVLLQKMARSNPEVQRRLFDRLDKLLNVHGAEPEMADALKEVFTGNKTCCLKILPSQVQKIMILAAQHLTNAPQFLDLLNAIVKVEELDLPLKRNQAYVMKYFMQYRTDVAFIIDQTIEDRRRILTSGNGVDLSYLISLVDMLATCAEGENRFIESICQTIFRIPELLEILNNSTVQNSLKRPFLRFFLWVYLNTASGMIESGAGDLPHDSEMWKFLSSLPAELISLTDYSKNNDATVKQLLKKAPEQEITKDDTPMSSNNGTLHYMFEAVMPFLQVFFRSYYQPSVSSHPEEADHVDTLARNLISFVEVVGPLLSNGTHLRTMVGSTSAVLSASKLPATVMDEFQQKYGDATVKNAEIKSDARRNYDDYYSGEEEVNVILNTFAVNCGIAYGGQNTIHAQIGFPSYNEYTELDGDEELPLGEEFQEHISCFINQSERDPAKTYQMAGKLVDHLSISNTRTNMSEKECLVQEEADIKCLQILRGIIHNEIMKLPDDWETNMKDNSQQLMKIEQAIFALNGKDAVIDILPHLAKPNDELVKEVLALLVCMLFEGNRTVQDSLIKYFLGTREESFFFSIKTKMQLSALTAKERRLLNAQHQAKVEEAIGQAKALRQAMQQGKITANMMGTNMGSMLLSFRGSKASLQAKRAKKKSSTTRLKSRMGGSRFGSKVSAHPFGDQLMGSQALLGSSLHAPQPIGMQHLTVDGNSDTRLNGMQNLGLTTKLDRSKQASPLPVKRGMLESNLALGMTKSTMVLSSPSPPPLKTSQVAPVDIDIKVEEFDDADLEELASLALDGADDLEYKDDGHIELVLQLLGGMCDGQNGVMQNYIREQPDNIKSVNLVAETSKFLSIVYSNINAGNIALVTQLFNTLVEFSQGNFQNQAVVFDNKVCDYINHILRSSHFKGCTKKQVYEMKGAVGSLMMSLIEENKPVVRQGEEEKPYDVAEEVMETLDSESIFQELERCYQEGQAIMMLKKKTDDALELKDLAQRVGFMYFHILKRMCDLDSENRFRMKEKVVNTASAEIVWYFYEMNTLSVEVLKQNVLQKVYFRVEEMNALREEIKVKFKYGVDRSSPSDKIRDFMDWSYDIIEDIKYQKKIHTNIVPRFFVTFSWWFNLFALLLSFIICGTILVTWKAPVYNDGTFVTNNTGVTVPTSDFTGYSTVIFVFGCFHNVFSLCVLITYFLSNRPTLPKWSIVRRKKHVQGDQVDAFEVELDHESHLEVKLFSFKTGYYIVFFAFSVLGTVFYGYFFCFHMLHIASMNQLLSRVILAVTKNGVSLLMVAVLGLILLYIYGLISFAFYRELYDSAGGFYCNYMYQCFVTMIHHGFLEQTYNYLMQNMIAGKSFLFHAVLAIYNVTFFILVTTIGLNIIFGIIVDTFSELRDSKWQVDKDMFSTCFICSRSSYDFDHHGNGFRQHVKQEHNQWSYLFFFIHIANTRPNDYTAIELDIYLMLLQKNYDFFPLHCALSLQDDADMKDAKIDWLTQQVRYLVGKMKEEETRKGQEQEENRQKKWKESIKEKTKS